MKIYDKPGNLPHSYRKVKPSQNKPTVPYFLFFVEEDVAALTKVSAGHVWPFNFSLSF
jgi:hypothetical protein